MDIQVCKLQDVREHGEGYPVDLMWDGTHRRFVLRAWNEGHNNTTEVDLMDLIAWLSSGPADRRVEGGFVLGKKAIA